MEGKMSMDMPVTSELSSKGSTEPIEQTCRAGRTRRVNRDAAAYAVQCVAFALRALAEP